MNWLSEHHHHSVNATPAKEINLRQIKAVFECSSDTEGPCFDPRKIFGYSNLKFVNCQRAAIYSKHFTQQSIGLVSEINVLWLNQKY